VDILDFKPKESLQHMWILFSFTLAAYSVSWLLLHVFRETSCFLAARGLILHAEYDLNRSRNAEIIGTKLFTSLSTVRLSLSGLS